MMTAKLYMEHARPTAEAPEAGPIRTRHEDAIGDLIVSIAAGNSAAFISFYRVTSRNIRLWIDQVLRDQSLTEDVAQEVYSKIWKSAHLYQFERSSGWGWIYSIAKNCAMDFAQRSRMEGESFSDAVDEHHILEIEDPTPTPEHRRMSRDLKQRINTHIASFAEVDREILNRIKLRGHPYHLVANDLGLNVNTVKTRARRALARLQELLASE